MTSIGDQLEVGKYIQDRIRNFAGRRGLPKT